MKRRYILPVALVVAMSAMVVACTSDTNVTVHDPGVDVAGDDDLPSAVVAENRPANPGASFQLDCPWGEVVSPQENPYLQGNLGPDDIPSIDDPIWLPLGDRDVELFSLEPVIAVEVAGQVRGVPVRVLLWNEVVNMCWDTPDGPLYTYLTYCPLVDAAVHFSDERGCDAKFQFGVSGGLFNGNLIVYDRATNQPGTPTALYVQLYGGGLDGTCGPVVPGFQHLTWEMFRRLYPYAEVLSVETGVAPAGGYDYFDHPYQEYWRSSDIWFPYASEGDLRMPVMQHVFGVLVPGAQKAYPARGDAYVANDELAGQRVVVWYDPEFDTSAAFEARHAAHGGEPLTFEFLGRESRGIPLYTDVETGTVWTFDGIAVDGPLAGERLARVVGIRVFWFAWVSFYPDTGIFSVQ